MSCQEVEERLTEAWLEHRALRDPHLEACERCRAHAEALERMASHLDGLAVPTVAPEQVEAWRQAAVRAQRARRVARSRTPLRPLARDLLRAAALALLALPFAVGHAAAVAWLGQNVLAGWLPSAALTWLAALYFVPIALAIAVLYGAIPFAVVLGRRGPLEET